MTRVGPRDSSAALLSRQEMGGPAVYEPQDAEVNLRWQPHNHASLGALRAQIPTLEAHFDRHRTKHPFLMIEVPLYRGAERCGATRAGTHPSPSGTVSTGNTPWKGRSRGTAR